MKKVTDKIVLITGASSGIGKATAEIFAEGGAKLILVARRAEKLESIATDLKERFGTESLLIKLDLQDRAAVMDSLSSIPAEWSEVDILVNNAGLAAGTDKLFEADLDDFEAMIDTNLKGLLYVSRAIVPGMVSRDRGHIINLGSIAGYDPYPGGAVYCGTKFFVRALSRVLKMDLGGTQVRVSSIDPGAVETEFSLVRFKGNQENADSVYKGMTPLTGEDIADTIYYCATRPPHVNVSQLLVMSTDQSSTTQINRRI